MFETRGIIMKTAKISSPMDGNKLYQKRARLAFPILVRQANAGSTIFYSELGKELEMPNARNLNYVLGSIGQTMKNLSKKWKEEIPPIQCLVVNKNTGLPGEGIGWFITSKDDFKKLSKEQKRRIVNAELQKIFAYTKWDMILDELDLEPATLDHFRATSSATRLGGGGESDQHKNLKKYISEHPKIFNLPLSLRGSIEYPLPSGDIVDVLFKNSGDYICVEAKSALSAEADIVRGIFQCVKYKAVMNAYLVSKGQPQNGRAILALESAFPKNLLSLKNILSVEVIDNINLTVNHFGLK